MSREIKFRVYDKEKNMWTNFKILDNTIYFMDKNTGVWFHEKYKAKGRFALMQYTGIKDKNDVEIYEGDILKYNFPYDGRLKHISPVSYLDTQASFGIVDFYGNNIPLYDIPTNNYFEVIGNIYENEELLKSEERKND